MEQGLVQRHEVIMAGVGGKGVLMAGQLLAQAAMSQYKHVVWFPSYASSMRGAPCECTVVFSHRRIVSPLLSQAEAVVIFSPSQFKPFERRAKSSGIILMDSAGFSGEGERKDVTLLTVSATVKAVELGDSRAANMVLLGAYLTATEALSPSLVEKEIEKRFGGDEALINKRALREGMKLVAKPSQ